MPIIHHLLLFNWITEQLNVTVLFKWLLGHTQYCSPLTPGFVLSTGVLSVVLRRGNGVLGAELRLDKWKLSNLHSALLFHTHNFVCLICFYFNKIITMRYSYKVERDWVIVIQYPKLVLSPMHVFYSVPLPNTICSIFIHVEQISWFHFI